MQRRHFIKASLALGGMALLPSRYAFGRALFPAEGQMTTLRNNVGFYTNRGGTIGWYLTNEGVVIVDTQFLKEAGELLHEVQQVNKQPIDLLVNTHHHRDHTSGNLLFEDIVTTHVAHLNAQTNMRNAGLKNNDMNTVLLPTTTFEKEWSQEVDKERVTLHYFGRGHTDGDAMVHFEQANIVHTGDLMFNRRFPYIDKSTGASIKNWQRVLRRARRTFDDDTIYIFGHAGDGHAVTGTAADLEAMENYLREMYRHVKKAKRSGQTLEQIKASTQSIPAAPEWQGSGIERSIEAAWAELNGQK